MDCPARSADAMALRLLAVCNQSLVRGSGEAQILQTICDWAVNQGGCHLAWATLAHEGAARTVAQAGAVGGSLPAPDAPGTLVLPLHDGSGEPLGALCLHAPEYRSQDAGQQAWLHEAADTGADVVLNAGAWTHYSYAIADAAALVGRYVEVHISNVHAREGFRAHSVLSAKAAGIIVGCGVGGYIQGQGCAKVGTHGFVLFRLQQFLQGICLEGRGGAVHKRGRSLTALCRIR